MTYWTLDRLDTELVMLKSVLATISRAISATNNAQPTTADTESSKKSSSSSSKDEPGKWVAMASEGQSFYLIELNEMLLEKILENLAVHDLAAFRRTCRTFRSVSPSQIRFEA